MKLPLRSAAAWTALLAMLAAALLIWAPLVLAATVPAAEEPDLAARSRALQRARQSVLGVQAVAVDQARSARTLGRERAGSGVLIGRDGLVLTIGYLLLEAEEVQLLHDDGRSVPARVVGFDLASGLGLLQALAPLALEPVPLGRPDALATEAPLMVASGGLGAAVSVTELVARRAFAGYWEYHIDGALFTSPPRGDHSGAGLFNAAGELVGIGSLLLVDVTPDGAQPRRPGNMFVPVNLLPAGLADLPTRGFGPPVPRAWLGLNCVESAGRLRVLRVTSDSPADVAGLEVGDQILRIDGTAVQTLAALWQALWTGGAAERAVTLAIERDGQPRSLTIYSVDRLKTLRRPEGI